MKKRIPTLDEFINESKVIDVDDIFTIDWDGKSTVKVTKIDNKNVTFTRCDKKGNLSNDDEDTMTVPTSRFKKQIIKYTDFINEKKGESWYVISNPDYVRIVTYDELDDYPAEGRDGWFIQKRNEPNKRKAIQYAKEVAKIKGTEFIN